MRRFATFAALLLLVAILAPPSGFAQQTTGAIGGRVVDQTGAAVPGATVSALQPTTGLTRTAVSDSVGVFRLTALPVGTYEVKVELSGFQPVSRKGLSVNLGQTVELELQLNMAGVSENVTVTGESPLIETNSSAVGGVVDVNKIEALPLNGRQFANLAMTIAGVGMGFHSDPTKSTQYSPQIAGGNGRNVNYQIDGGDNNDDTVGGLLQLFPLEAIEQFNFVTQRYKAEYGRSNGGVMNIVTKSGTNNFTGSFFTMARDKSLNAQTTTEKINKIDKQYYRRYQYGGSFGGPLVQNRAHFFFAAERTQQDTRQTVTTFGLFPSQEGTYATPMRENLMTVKSSVNLTPQQLLMVRYGRNTNSQVYGIGARATPDSWGDSKNTFNSINVNHNWVLGASKLNEIVFQYADFANNITGRTSSPGQNFPNGVTTGLNANVPQTTIQHKFQFRDDFSWHIIGKGGLGHDFKTGFNFINEPKLYVTFNSGSLDYTYAHQNNDVNGPISTVSRNKDGSAANLPTKQYGLYIQDDWRLTSRVTVNAGLRYDLVTGFAIDQTTVPNFNKLQAAGQAGRLDGMQGIDEWGPAVSEDYNNIQPRIGIAWDLKGNGKDVVRAGWGLYYDFGFTNANILFPGLSAQGGSGQIFSVTNSSGIKKPGGDYYRFGDPIATIASLNEINPALGFYSSNVAAPRVRQPYTQQLSAGWSHQLTPSTVFDADYVYVRGHDLGLRWQLNTRVGGPTGPRRLADLGLSPSNPTFNISRGASKFDSITVGIRRRMEKHLQVNGWYSLSKAIGLGGLGADELTFQSVQDATNPFADIQWGPTQRTDARHKVTVSAVIELPHGFNVSPIFRYRSALPLFVWQGYDVNGDGATNDIATEAFAFDGLDADYNPKYKSLGACTTINCGRAAAQSQMNLRMSKVFALPGRMHVEAIVEIFNLFNAMNPTLGGGGAVSAGRRYLGTSTPTNLIPNTNFMRPTVYAGDNGQPEQRVAQLGFRFTF